MPRLVAPLLLLLATLALVPFACIARARVVRSSEPRVHLVQDMDNQGRYKAQQASALFANRRAMRRPVEGTVALKAPITKARLVNLNEEPLKNLRLGKGKVLTLKVAPHKIATVHFALKIRAP